MRILTAGAWLGVLAAAAIAAPRPATDHFGVPGSAGPNLARVGDSAAALTWLEPLGERRYALRLAVRTRGRWDAPRTILVSDSFFVNWADFPSFVALADGAWMVHWPARVPGGTYAYHVRVAVSRDGGRSWSAPITPHRDRTPQEHGFVSMVPWDDTTAAILWLDGRDMKLPAPGSSHDAEGDMSLRFTLVSASGALRDDALLDARTCECCQTALARTAGGVIAAYRDRSAREIRDIAVTRRSRAGGGWTAPVVPAPDRWTFPGCPVNGPALAAAGDTVALAWFAAPEGKGRVAVAFSLDGGATWTRPVRVDEGSPLGRVSVQLLDRGDALVTWLEAGAEPAVRARRVSIAGRRERAWVVAPGSDTRASGFLRSVRLGDEVLFAWRSEEGIAVERRRP